MTLNLYGIFFILSFAVSFGVAAILMRKQGMNKMFILYSVLLNFISTFYCSRLFTVFISGFKLNIITAGSSSIGGVLGLMLGIIIMTRIVDDKSYVFWKSYALVIPLMYSISKLGCHFAGCCHGIDYDGPLAIHYNNQYFVTGNLFPVQALESLTFLVIFIVGLLLFFKFHNRYTVHILIILCSLAKSTLAYLREEQVGVIISPNQVVCLILITCVIIAIVRNRMKQEN